MGKSTTMSTGAVWLRIGIFVAASIVLSWASEPLLGPVLSQLTQGTYPVIGLVLIPFVSALPTLAAAVLAWLLPRPVARGSSGPTRPWFWCVVLCLIGLGVQLALTLGTGGMNGWSDSGALSTGAMDLWIAAWVVLPTAAVQALVSMTLLWGIARRAMSAARAGLLVAVTLALPSAVSTVLATMQGGGFAGDTGGIPGGVVATQWTIASVLQACAWAVLYSGLGRLLDGRGPVARWVLGALVLVPLLLSSTVSLPFLSRIALDGSVWGTIPRTVSSMSLVLLLGALAWAFSARRVMQPRRATVPA